MPAPWPEERQALVQSLPLWNFPEIDAILWPMATCIGMFDSGLGGLSVWRAVRALLPHWPIHYVADQARCPYGPRPHEEIRQFSLEIADFLRQHDPALIVVACNTATGAAIQSLRETWPDLPFVGMEPALKPAAEHSQSGVIGVLATQGTFAGGHFQRTKAQHADGKEVHIQQGDGLVELVENGMADSDEAEAVLRKYLDPMLSAGADQIVLGCSHYPFLEARMRQIVGDQAHIIDPSPAIAKQVQRLLGDQPPTPGGKDLFFTSGDRALFREQLGLLLPGQEDKKVLTFDP